MVIFLLVPLFSSAQERTILVPKAEPGSPFKVSDTNDLFGQSYRWFIEGDYQRGVDSLRQLITQAGIVLDKEAYYIVVANFNNEETPIGIFHGNSHFHDTRLYGLKSDSLFYIFISRDKEAKSYLSTVLIRKSSYFEEVLPHFIGLFPIFSQATVHITGKYRTWMDVRKFEIPKKFQKNCDISVIVKKDLSDERFLAHEVFDNTSLERWSFGIGTAITSVDDVDITLENGVIVIRPKPKGDLATFGLINYHFKAVDTKARRMSTSIHLSGGLRISETIEPILGFGFGIPIDFIDLHIFGGYSVEFSKELKSEYHIGQTVAGNVDPFKLKLKGKPRVGIEIKFP